MYKFRKADKDNNRKEIKNTSKIELYNKLFTNDPLLYLPKKGVLNCKTLIYNNYVHDLFHNIFNIFDKYGLEYYVFAGSAIGYLRNKKNIPWADDYDIIIFKDQQTKFEEIINVLNKNTYHCTMPHIRRPDLYPNFCGWQIGKSFIGNNKNGFLLDVFLTTVDENNNIRNTCKWGRYDTKKIPLEYVKPQNYLIFDNLKLPFFNNVEDYVKLEYNDVFNSVRIYLNHTQTGIIVINNNWKIVYDEIYKIINEAKDNTKKIILIKNDYKPLNKLVIKENETIFKDEFDLLKYINLNDIGTIFIENNLNFLNYCFTIKYYYPDINIKLYLYSVLDNSLIFELNYVDTVCCANEKIYNILNDEEIFYLNKPIIKLTTVITFGTYDLFHIGHLNLFLNCKKYGTTLFVGVSSDELNIKKGKISFNNINKRLEDCKNNENVDITFIEESLELKDNYILKYNADMLIMGDDWENKFDWVSCMSKYLPRTPDISTTILKRQPQLV